jgi:APA family basic amino acid/polyamine antiporter
MDPVAPKQGALRPYFKTFMAVKPLEAHSAAASPTGLRRTLGPWDLLFLGIGAIIGTGVFVLAGPAAAHHAGPAASLSFALAGFTAALAGLCYAEMAAMLPLSGSAYTYAYATVGELSAFLIGWNLILEYGLAAGMVSVAWSSYAVSALQQMFGIALPHALCHAPFAPSATRGGLGLSGAYLNVPAVLILLAITGMLCLGTQLTMRVMGRLVVVKLAVIAVFVLASAPYVQAVHWTPFVPTNAGSFGSFGLSGVLQAATLLFFSYCGFDAVSTAAQECRNPQRDLPRAMLGSIAVAALVYMAVTLILTGVVDYRLLGREDAVSMVLTATGQTWLSAVVQVGALTGLSTVMLAQVFGQVRILFAMASDFLLPKALLHLHPTTAIPRRLTLLVGLCAAAIGGLFPLEILGELSSVCTLVAFMIVSFGVMLLRLNRPDAPRRFKVPGGAFALPLLSVSLNGLLLCTAKSQSLLRLAIWMGCGLSVYLLYSRPRSKLRQQNAEQ